MRRCLIALALIVTVGANSAAATNYPRLVAKVDPAVAVIYTVERGVVAASSQQHEGAHAHDREDPKAGEAGQPTTFDHARSSCAADGKRS